MIFHGNRLTSGKTINYYMYSCNQSYCTTIIQFEYWQNIQILCCYNLGAVSATADAPDQGLH